MDSSGSFRYRFRVLLRVLGIILLFVVVLGGVYTMTLFSPQRVKPANVAVSGARAEQTAAQEKRSMELADQFKRNVILRPALEEDFALLDQALEAEATILALNSGHNTNSFLRTEELRKLRDEHRALQLNGQSVQAEQAAHAAADRESALEQITLAWELQERINRDYPRSSSVNLLRLVRLKREMDRRQAEPLNERSVAAEAAAQAAQDSEQWTVAVQQLELAIALQARLNEEYRGQHFSNPQRLNRLQEKLDSLRASDVRERMLELEAAAEQAQKAGEYQKVAASMEQLIRLQELVNRDFSNSRFASDDALKVYERRRDEARSQGMISLIRDQDATVDSLLRARNSWKAAELIGTLTTQIESFTMTFPGSTGLSEAMVLKYKFLTSVRGDISLLQDRLYGQLLPLPSETTTRMLRTEVPQALYESVMSGANPSRNREPLLPVDSVNHDEALEFARRVGWLLGLPANLPTEQQYRMGLGVDRYARLADQTWNVENALGVTHEVGTREPNRNGFYDLLGNVSEWLLSDELRSGREARQIGGSIESTVDQLADVPVQISNALGRNRHNGFRIVVDATQLEQTAPAAAPQAAQ